MAAVHNQQSASPAPRPRRPALPCLTKPSPTRRPRREIARDLKHGASPSAIYAFSWRDLRRDPEGKGASAAASPPLGKGPRPPGLHPSASTPFPVLPGAQIPPPEAPAPLATPIGGEIRARPQR